MKSNNTDCETNARIMERNRKCLINEYDAVLYIAIMY